MEKIEFEEGLVIHQTNIKSPDFQDKILKESKSLLKIAPPSQHDNYPYSADSWNSLDFESKYIISNNIDRIIKICILGCLKLIELDDISFNKINLHSWINVVKATKPKQTTFNKDGSVVLHNHIDIQNNIGSFYPNYTFVYYTQMPDNLSDNDGKLIIGGKDKQYYYLPEIGDIVIMGGGIPHSPNHALKSTKDRIVIAGNVGVEYVKHKPSLI